MNNDTNSHTIDIPLPGDDPNAQTSPHTQVTADDHNPTPLAATTANQMSADNAIAGSVHNSGVHNPYAMASPHLQQQQQAYHQYYQQYYYQQMAPQMVPQTYPYFMPQLIPRPMVPMGPQVATITPQMSAIINHNTNHHNNSSRAADQTSGGEAYSEAGEDSDDSDPTIARHGTTKASNVLPIHCNEKMGLNPLIFQNIQQSPYFKNNLFQLKTYHEVIDEIFYSVRHLEPWEKGSRKVGGQTGMCGSVRGVGAGGIISTPFCILYKLFTLKLTRKQVNGLIRHKDSPYIRSLGFMYIRFTQPPQHLFNWFAPFLEDEEEVDPKAGGGQTITIGQMCRHMLTKLDWYSSLFPRVPVPIQKEIESKLKARDEEYEQQMREERGVEEGEVEEEEAEEAYEEDNKTEDTRGGGGRADSRNKHRRRSVEREKPTERRRSRSRDRDRRSRQEDGEDKRSNDKHRHRRSRTPQSPHSHRSHNRGDHRSDRSERNDHKRRHR